MPATTSTTIPVPSMDSNVNSNSNPLLRLQQSARDIIRNLESTVLTQQSQQQQQTSKDKSNHLNDALTFEQTIRSMFTSCTFGATSMTRNDDDDDQNNDNDDTSTLNVVGVGTSSTDDSSSTSISQSMKPIKKVVKQQPPQRSKSMTIPSTTTNTTTYTAKQQQQSATTNKYLRRLASMHIMESSNYNNNNNNVAAADHIYENLFFAEEEARRQQEQQQPKRDPVVATTAPTVANNVDVNIRPSVLSPMNLPEVKTSSVLPIREPQQVSPNLASNNRSTLGIIPLRRMTQPFPMSQPIVATTTTPRQVFNNETGNINAVTTTVVTANITQNRTFDDDISAISAHTLEAMVAVVVQSQQLDEQDIVSHKFMPVMPVSTTTKKNEAFLEENRTADQCKSNNVVNDNDVEPLATTFCRAETIPRANNILTNHQNSSTNYYRSNTQSPSQLLTHHELPHVRVCFSSSSSLSLSKQQRRSSFNSHGGLLRTPSSGRSITSHNSTSNKHRPFHLNNRSNSGSFSSPNTSGGASGGNRSFDRWRQVEQDFWDSVVADDNNANDDVHNNFPMHDAGEDFVDVLESNGPVRINPSLHRTYPPKLSPKSHGQRLNNKSMDGVEWSCRSRGGDTTTADSTTIFSSSLTGITHTQGSRHSVTLPSRERSSSLQSHNSWSVFQPKQEQDMNETNLFFNNPIIFASTAIQDDFGFDITMESGEI